MSFEIPGYALAAAFKLWKARKGLRRLYSYFSNKSRLSPILFLIISSHVFGTTVPLNPRVSQDSDLIDMNFESMVDIKELINWVSRHTGKNILFDARVNGQIRLICPKKVSRSEAYQLLLSSLEVLDYAVVGSGSIFKIVKQSESVRSSVPVYAYRDHLKNSSHIATFLLPLKYVDAEKIRLVLTRFIRPDAIISNAATNTLIISDTSANIEKIHNIIEIMDVNSMHPNLDIIPILYTNATDVFKKLKELQTQQGKNLTGSGQTMLVDERTNSIALFGSKTFIKTQKDIIHSFDKDISDNSLNNSYQMAIRPISFANAKSLATILNSFQEPKKALSHNKDTKNIQINSIEDSNSLLMSGSLKQIKSIQKLIQKLDFPKKQIFLETLILEITGNYGLRLTTSALLGYKNPGADGNKVVYGWQAQDMAPIVTASAINTKNQASQESIQAIAQMFADSMSMGVLGNSIEISGIGSLTPGAFVKFLREDSLTKILATPYAFSRDMEEAQLSFGETVFFRNNEIDSAGIISSKVEKEKINTTLTFKPNIHYTDYVTLDFNLEFDTITNIENGIPAIAHRKNKQSVTLRNGQTAVLAGMNKLMQIDSVSKMPLLGDIPIIGALFKRTIQTQERTQLIIFATPHIIANFKDLKQIYEKRKNSNTPFWDHAKTPGFKEDFFSSDGTGNGQEIGPIERAQELMRKKLEQEALSDLGYTEKL